MNKTLEDGGNILDVAFQLAPLRDVDFDEKTHEFKLSQSFSSNGMQELETAVDAVVTGLTIIQAIYYISIIDIILGITGIVMMIIKIVGAKNDNITMVTVAVVFLTIDSVLRIIWIIVVIALGGLGIGAVFTGGFSLIHFFISFVGAILVINGWANAFSHRINLKDGGMNDVITVAY